VFLPRGRDDDGYAELIDKWRTLIKIVCSVSRETELHRRKN